MANDQYLTGDDVARFLEGNKIGRYGTDITVDNAPEHKTDVVTVYNNRGGSSMYDIPVDDVLIHIEVRKKAASNKAAIQLAHDIYRLLNRKANISINGKDIMRSQAVAPPQVVGLDEKKRWLVTTTYNIRVRRADEEE